MPATLWRLFLVSKPGRVAWLPKDVDVPFRTIGAIVEELDDSEDPSCDDGVREPAPRKEFSVLDDFEAGRRLP